MRIVYLLLIASFSRFTLGTKVEKDTSIWEMVEMVDQLANTEDNTNEEVEKQLKTLNENIKQLLSGNFSSIPIIPSISQAEKKQKVPMNVEEPKDESNETSSHNSSCSCSDFVNRNGFGRCRKPDSKFGGLANCYVNFPTSCPDLIRSGTNPEKYTSAKACKSVVKRWSNCPKQVTIAGIHDVEGLYMRQPRLVNGKVYYRATEGDFCISWDKVYQHWWIQRCRFVGRNVGLAYLADKEAQCPNANSQVWISVYKGGQRIGAAQVKEYFCQAIDGQECIFPAKWGDSTYYTCSFNGAFIYRWCATSVKPNGEYKTWNYCNPNYKCSARPPKRGSSKEKQKQGMSLWQIIFG